MTIEPHVLDWLMNGDVAIRYLVSRHLLEDDTEAARWRRQIPEQGWGRTILELQRPDGDWGRGYYQPKWTSTHYTLLDLMHMGMPPDTPGPRRAVDFTIRRYLADDGALNFAGSGRNRYSDDCVTAMFLGCACYFGAEDRHLRLMADHLLARTMGDGGWNCRLGRSGAVHSSVHTTISVLEAYRIFRERLPDCRADEIVRAVRAAEEFLLVHRLYRSHRTGEPMDSRFMMLSWPARWYYDILRGLEYFADAGQPHDPRMNDALEVLMSKRRADGFWPVQNRHPGEEHLQMEKTGGKSRWNTYRALKVLARLR